MNMIHDAGRFAPPEIAGLVRPFSTPSAVALSALGYASDAALRQDSEGTTTARGVRWRDHIMALANGDKAIERRLAAQIAPIVRPQRQDSGASQFATAGKIQIGAPIVNRIQDYTDILDGIPARPVDGNASGYYRNFVSVGGTATLLRGDTSAINRVSYTTSQDLRPLHWCGVALSTGWLESRRMQGAGMAGDDARWKMIGVQRAIQAFWWKAILDGSTVPGLDFYSIATVPGLLRQYSSVNIGTDSISTVVPELVRVMTVAQERSPAMLQPDTVIITDRLRNRLMGTTALPYSTNDAFAFFVEKAQALGLTVVIGKSLRDFASGYDGMLFFRSDANEGLRIVKGLDITPVHTYVDAAGTNTIYASSGGGLELPYVEGCNLALFPYS
jgi:hypothetical protein